MKTEVHFFAANAVKWSSLFDHLLLVFFGQKSSCSEVLFLDYSKWFENRKMVSWQTFSISTETSWARIRVRRFFFLQSPGFQKSKSQLAGATTWLVNTMGLSRPRYLSATTAATLWPIFVVLLLRCCTTSVALGLHQVTTPSLTSSSSSSSLTSTGSENKIRPTRHAPKKPHQVSTLINFYDFFSKRHFLVFQELMKIFFENFNLSELNDRFPFLPWIIETFSIKFS